MAECFGPGDGRAAREISAHVGRSAAVYGFLTGQEGNALFELRGVRPGRIKECKDLVWYEAGMNGLRKVTDFRAGRGSRQGDLVGWMK